MADNSKKLYFRNQKNDQIMYLPPRYNTKVVCNTSGDGIGSMKETLVVINGEIG